MPDDFLDPIEAALARFKALPEGWEKRPLSWIVQDCGADLTFLTSQVRPLVDRVHRAEQERDRWRKAANWAKYHGRYLGWAADAIHAYDDSLDGPYDAQRVARVIYTTAQGEREADELEAMVRAADAKSGNKEVRKVGDLLEAAEARGQELRTAAQTVLRNSGSSAKEDGVEWSRVRTEDLRALVRILVNWGFSE